MQDLTTKTHLNKLQTCDHTALLSRYIHYTRTQSPVKPLYDNKHYRDALTERSGTGVEKKKSFTRMC